MANTPSGYENGRHPNSLANLKTIRTSDKGREMGKVSGELSTRRARDKKLIKVTLKEFIKGNKDIPKISPLDVIRAAMISSLSQDNLEDASRYASMLAEYEYSKLQRVETKSTIVTADLSEDELQKIILSEGLGRLLPSITPVFTPIEGSKDDS